MIVFLEMVAVFEWEEKGQTQSAPFTSISIGSFFPFKDANDEKTGYNKLTWRTPKRDSGTNALVDGVRREATAQRRVGMVLIALIRFRASLVMMDEKNDGEPSDEHGHQHTLLPWIACVTLFSA